MSTPDTPNKTLITDRAALLVEGLLTASAATAVFESFLALPHHALLGMGLPAAKLAPLIIDDFGALCDFHHDLTPEQTVAVFREARVLVLNAAIEASLMEAWRFVGQLHIPTEPGSRTGEELSTLALEMVRTLAENLDPMLDYISADILVAFLKRCE